MLTGSLNALTAKSVFTYSQSIIETREQCVKSVQG